MISGNQRGAALVESAIVIVLFLMLLLGIAEFGLLLFTWVKGVEGVRAASRFAIVNDPANSLDLSTALDCEGNPSDKEEVTCTSGKCGQIFTILQNWLPRADGGNVKVTYSCSSAGSAERPGVIPEVTVEASGVLYNMVTPGLLGFPSTITLPTMSSTRTGEDLETVTP